MVARGARTIVWLTLAAGIAAFAVAPAGAQLATSLEVERVVVPEGRLTPDESLGHVEVHFLYRYPAVATVGGVTTVEVSTDCPPTVSMTGSRSHSVSLGPSGEARVNATFRAQVAREAPGLEPLTCAIAATASPPAPGFDEAHANGTVTVEAAYVGVLRANTAASIQQGRPGATLTFPIEVTSLANAATVVDVTGGFSVGASGPEDVGEMAPHAHEGWTLRLPEPVRLEPAATVTVDVEVVLPDDGVWVNRDIPFEVHLTPASLSGDPGEPVSVTLLARARGSDGAASVPAPLALVPLAAALLLRRRA